MELVPAGWNFGAFVLIEIFAGEERSVSILLQQHRQCSWFESLAPVLTVAAAAQRVVQGAMIVRIQPGQQARSGGAAERGAGERIFELCSVQREHLHCLVQWVQAM